MKKFYFLLTLQYDGYDLSGWIKQPNNQTVQGELEKALKVLTKNADFHLIGASKTDAQVHALDQKVWLELSFNPIQKKFIRGLNKIIHPALFIKSIKKIDANFYVRHVKQKVYVYKLNFGQRSIFNYRYELFLEQNNFNLAAFKEAIPIFIGQHDFLNFSGLNLKELESIASVRTIDSISLVINKAKISLVFKARGFIRYQIRMIVGALLAIAQNKVTIEHVKKVLNRDEPKMRYIAPGYGLLLKKIIY